MTPATDDALAPLDLALNAEVAILAASADRGDPSSQLAMSIVADHGLHGQTVSPEAASRWRIRALTQYRVMPITQYTPAFNGQPSRVNIIHVQVRAIQPAQIAVIEKCVDALASGDAAAEPCGQTEASRISRRDGWRRAS